MTKGPIEALAARPELIEGRAGLRPEPARRRLERKGRLRPGGRWLSERLRREHSEALNRAEQDMLGNALVGAEERNRGGATTVGPAGGASQDQVRVAASYVRRE
jgi:hypothetical protein